MISGIGGRHPLRGKYPLLNDEEQEGPMKKVLSGAGLCMIAIITACGAGDERTHEGPMSFEAPTGEGWEQVPVESDLPDHAWTMGLHYNADETPKSLRVMPDVDSRPDASTAVSTLIAVCRFTEVYATDCQGTGQEAADIPGSDNTVQADFTYSGESGEQGRGRFWVAADEDSDVVSAVEYAGIGVDEDELEAFGETIEFDPDNAE